VTTISPNWSFDVDLSVDVGSVQLPNPVMTASGTAGHGAELDRYVPLATLGAHVVKSLAAFAWQGNPSPRLHPTPLGMLNSVGLQGPGVAAWLADLLPTLERTGARIVASIWGRTVGEFREAAELMAGAGPSVVAVEVNLSCPNLEGGRHLFAYSPRDSAEVVAAATACGRPLWAKLSAATDRLVEVAAAVAEAGAEALTLINTVPGLAIDLDTRMPVLGAGGGALSGPALHPVAVRAVFDVHAALRDMPIVGVGGVTRGVDVVELILAGASAVQVGTATFADPRAAGRVLAELTQWCRSRRIDRIAELCGNVHRRQVQT
jgi:dihydroorotate dehydrogenase (NAD+) catalytic subunit